MAVNAPAVTHTADIDEASLAAIHELLIEAFAGDFDDDDWDHALGGLHVLAREGDTIVGHAAVVQRQLLHDGHALRCGYVEAMAVAPTHQRRGHGTAIMREVNRIILAAYDLGALGATDEGAPLYRAFDWVPWQGETYAALPTGTERTPDADDAIHVLQTQRATLNLDGTLTCEFRRGDGW